MVTMTKQVLYHRPIDIELRLITTVTLYLATGVPITFTSAQVRGLMLMTAYQPLRPIALIGVMIQVMPVATTSAWQQALAQTPVTKVAIATNHRVTVYPLPATLAIVQTTAHGWTINVGQTD